MWIEICYNLPKYCFQLAESGSLSGGVTPGRATPPFLVTIAPTTYPVCQPIKPIFNYGDCTSLLPYKDALFPNSFASDSDAADFQVAGIKSGLSCSNDVDIDLMLCYVFFQPCDQQEARLCKEVCDGAKASCPGECIICIGGKHYCVTVHQSNLIPTGKIFENFLNLVI